MSEHPSSRFELLGENQLEWRRLKRLVEHRQKPFVIWVSSNSPLFLSRLYALFVEEYARRFDHMEVNLAGWDGSSVFRYLLQQQQEKPAPNRIFHLRGMRHDDEDLFWTLNGERELIFGKLDASVAFWCDERTELAFQHTARDFWDWLFYRFYLPVKEPAALSAETAAHEKAIQERRLQRLLRAFHLLISQPPTNPRDIRDLLETTQSLAEIYEQQGNAAEALRYAKVARQIQDNQPVGNFWGTGKDKY